MLVLLVGPPGAGKDTLLDAARQALVGDLRFRFVRRAIDQPRDKRLGSHEPLEPAVFAARREAGAFALHWHSGGMEYGIPGDIAIDLAQGRVVVANVPRTKVAEAAARFPTRVIELTVPADILARRLVAKGRSDAVDAARRMSRPLPLPPGVVSETVVNDGTVEQGARRLVAALNRLAEGVTLGAR